MENQITVSAELRDINVITTEIKTLCAQAQTMALTYAVEIGRRLKEAKSMLPHGEWGNYLKERVNFSQSSANNFMRIFDEYGAKQISIFGAEVNSQALGNLSYTKALQLLAIPQEEREIFLNDNNVEDISSRELDRLIKERDAALKEAERTKELEQKIAELQEAAESNAEMAENLESESQTLIRQIEEMNEELEKAREAEKKAKDKYKELKNNPTIPDEVLTKMKAEAESSAAAASAAKIQDKIDEANKKIEEAIAAKKEAEEAAKASTEKIEALQKQIQMSNPDVMAFKTLFDQAQEIMKKINNCIDKIQSADSELAGKLKAAIKAFAQQYVG